MVQPPSPWLKPKRADRARNCAGLQVPECLDLWSLGVREMPHQRLPTEVIGVSTLYDLNLVCKIWLKQVTNASQKDISMHRRRSLFHNTRVTENDRNAAFHLKTGAINYILRREVWMWERQRISHEKGISLEQAEAEMNAQNWKSPKPKYL